ncbi:MAG TPA: chemotaxis protein CheW [Anaeromyxobacter sp.]|nr:chemotaxis protein CheW [Anaeromyxobacter sp.]
MAEPIQICTFALEGSTFALPVAEIREVVRGLSVTPVPLAGGAVRGLVNLRGQIAMAVDLRRRFDLPARPSGQDEVNVVVDAGEGPVCLTVDDVGDVILVPADSIERPPETLRPGVRELVRGICKRDDGLVLLLDTSRAIAIGALRREPDSKP